MRERSQVVLAFLTRQADNVLFVVALLAIAIGCAIERPALGLIVPGSIVLSLIVLAWVARSVGAQRVKREVHEEPNEDRGA